jgi:hypothetical protein
MWPNGQQFLADEEFLDAKTFADYLTCKHRWLDGARDTEERLQCTQRVLRNPKMRDVKTWPAHGLLKMLGQEWHDKKLVGALSRLIEQSSGFPGCLVIYGWQTISEGDIYGVLYYSIIIAANEMYLSMYVSILPLLAASTLAYPLLPSSRASLRRKTINC